MRVRGIKATFTAQDQVKKMLGNLHGLAIATILNPIRASLETEGTWKFLYMACARRRTKSQVQGDAEQMLNAQSALTEYGIGSNL